LYYTAGIQAPTREFLDSTHSRYVQATFPQNHVLDDFVKEQAMVHVTLIARRVCKSQLDLYPTDSESSLTKQELTNAWKSSSSTINPHNQEIVKQKKLIPLTSNNVPMTLIGRIRKPTIVFFPWLGQDISSLLVQKGQAYVLSSGLVHVDLPLYPTLHKSTHIKHIHSDAKYIETLSEYEYKAIQTNQGLWSLDAIRRLKPEVIQEVEFQKQATVWKKIWRRIQEIIYAS